MPAQSKTMPGTAAGSSQAERIEVKTLSCARFSFNWHLNYVYTDDSAPLLPAGTILQTIQWYDNSRANPKTPIPTRRSPVEIGPSTKWRVRGSASTTCRIRIRETGE